MADEPTTTKAEQIADYLFTNAFGDRADRLVLELAGKRDGGGWCRGAVVAAISRILEGNNSGA